MTELEELKNGLTHIVNEMSVLQKQAEVIEKRIEVLENKQEEPETFDSILNKLVRNDILNDEESARIKSHSKLYEKLKWIEEYVNKKFGGNINWNDEIDKFHPLYNHSSNHIYVKTTTCGNRGGFYFNSEDVCLYFIQVCKDQLIEFFKTSH